MPKSIKKTKKNFRKKKSTYKKYRKTHKGGAEGSFVYAPKRNRWYKTSKKNKISGEEFYRKVEEIMRHIADLRSKITKLEKKN